MPRTHVETRTLCIRAPEELLARVEALAKSRGHASASSVVREALRRGLEALETPAR